MFQVLSVEEAKTAVLDALYNYRKKRTVEQVRALNASGRIVANKITARDTLPPFSRSTMDGYAVRAEDTFGASDAVPGMLELIGSIEMGEESKQQLKTNQAVKIATGGMLPPGADAVVMVENVDLLDETSIVINTPVSPLENVIQEGDDVNEGDVVLKEGHLLRPQDIGALAALGIEQVEVFKSPTVAIVSTGNELISPSHKLQPGKIRDINSWSLHEAVRCLGGVPVPYGIVSDNKAAIQAKLTKAKSGNDILLVTGGSSVGTMDMTREVIDSLGEPGIIFHGVSVKPGKPTICGMADGTPVFGLSGNPVSAMITFRLFVKPVINYLLGNTLLKEQIITAKLTRNLSSRGGREDYIRVRLEEENDEKLAYPVLGESGLIFTMVNADGFIKIPQNSEGISSGEFVDVTLF